MDTIKKVAIGGINHGFSCSFKYDISLPRLCCKWGNPLDGGKNFSGIVGDLLNGYSDIGWANMFYTQERSQIIDYIDPYNYVYGAFMVNY